MASSSSNHPWTSHFTVQFDSFSGYVNDEITAYELIKAYEIATTSCFTVFKQTAGFSDSNGKENRDKHRVCWQDPDETTGYKLEFDGVPFEIAGLKILDCQNGPDKNAGLKILDCQNGPDKNAGLKILDCQNGPDKNKAKKKKEALKKTEKNGKQYTSVLK